MRPAIGAGEGNRTLVASLEGWSSAIELRPLFQTNGGDYTIFRRLKSMAVFTLARVYAAGRNAEVAGGSTILGSENSSLGFVVNSERSETAEGRENGNRRSSFKTAQRFMKVRQPR